MILTWVGEPLLQQMVIFDKRKRPPRLKNSGRILRPTFRLPPLDSLTMSIFGLRIGFLSVAVVVSLAFAPSIELSHAIEPQDALVVSDAEWLKPTFWESQDGKPVHESWEFANGEVRLVKSRDGNAALLSKPLPTNFELSFQWMVSPGTNSGLKYRVRKFGDLWLGLEYQMIDEPIPLKEMNKGSTASIYDIVEPLLDKPLRPAGMWNEAKIIAVGDRLEHYLNGKLVTQAIANGPEWDAKFVRSKFYGQEGFAHPRQGDRVMLTDHGGTAAFKNFRMKELPPPESKPVPTPQAPQLGNAMRNSWATQDSIVLWTRTTTTPEMVTEGPDFLPIAKEVANRLAESSDPVALTSSQLPAGASLDRMIGASVGAPGEVRLTYFPVMKRNASISTEWSKTSVENDFTQQWRLQNLEPGTEYAAVVEARPMGKEALTCVRRGTFQTAFPVDSTNDLMFCMTTCHDYPRRDDGSFGHKIYRAMNSINPNFVVHAGDIEYYDHEKPWAWTIELMRFKWGRLFSLPNNRAFYANRTTYFQKDDHDTLKDDCWAGQRFGAVTFEQGLKLFNEEQFPTQSPRYTTVRWGKDLQIWLLEGRDYRSPNRMPDGPDKTILGTEQKEWLKKTLRESTAKFKLVFSPTPIVGPDRDNKRDNHANEVFDYEGSELRAAIGMINGAIVFCGDRHWQYASVDPENKVWEFGCGPGSEKHQLGWKAGDVRPSHKFLRVEGGFLSGQLTHNGPASTLTIRHHKVTGEQVSEFVFP